MPFGITNTTSHTNDSQNKFIEVTNPPTDCISSLKFSPAALTTNTFLTATSWDGRARVWEIAGDGSTNAKAEQMHQGPDGSKIFTACADKTVQMWDLAANQMMQVGAHDAPVKTVHFISCPAYTCLVTGGWDKRLRFWDLRQPNPMMSVDLPDKIYCADVVFPLAIFCTANNKVVIYNLEGTPKEYSTIDSPLQHQSRCAAIFFDKVKQPTGYAIGCIEGRTSISYLNPTTPKDNFTFKCHRSQTMVGGFQEVYPVNDLTVHPIHNTLVTVGSDGRYAFWDKDARIKLHGPDASADPITASAIDAKGMIFAYASCYDWSKGHQFNDPNKQPKIFLRTCMDEMKPNGKR